MRYPPASAAGLLAGVALDALLGDPRRWHPVAGFGALAARVERALHRDHRLAGAAFVGTCLAPVAALGVVTERATRDRPLARAAATAVATWAVLGSASLAREAAAFASDLETGDVGAARRRLPSLCGRDPAALDSSGLARATVESVAENTSDAAVAPLVWGAVLGIPGLLTYRAVNTLDAMVGYRSPRYANFGWAAARLDDVVNLFPARATGLLAVALAPVVDGDRGKALDVLRRDGGRHPSPNAGRCEAAFAGALDLTLGGRNRYGDDVEDRPTLGSGRPPEPSDVARAVRLSRAVTVVAAVFSAAGSVLMSGTRDRGLTARLRTRAGVS